MDAPFKGILGYIRSFFGINSEKPARKRRGSFIEVISPKTGRYSPYGTRVIPIERELGGSPYGTRIIPIQRESEDIPPRVFRKFEANKKLHQKQSRSPMKPLWPEGTVVIDDDDDLTDSKKPSFMVRGRGKLKGFTSTPTDPLGRISNGTGCENGDDIIFVKVSKSPKEKQAEAKSAGFSYMTSKSNQNEKPLFSIGVGSPQNGTRSKDKTKQSYMRSSLNNSRVRDSLDYTFRLDDKLQYKKLIEQATNTSLQNNSSIYQTPLGKLFDSYDILNSSSRKAKSPQFDLDKSKEKPTVKETIMKVIESEPVIIRDSDSEESVQFVQPPSPKPDIKVDPVNSFKKIVDTSKVSKKDWLEDFVERHKQAVEGRQRDIDSLRQCSEKAEEINKDINIELLRRKVNECLQLKEVILPEIVLEPEAELPELTEEHRRMVQRAFKGNPNEVLASKFNLNITRRDLLTLAGLNWLNDEVINFYMNLIIERGKDLKWPKSYAFNTFFYTKLLKDGPQALRRWTKRVDLFSYDLICVPVHLGMHWCMAIIDFRDRSIRYYDSMGSPNNRCIEALRNYLEVEHMDKKSAKYDTNDFELENMEDIPQQMNGSDCGMFACTFAEFVTRNAKITFKQEDMPYFRKKMVVEIMTGD